MKPRGVLIAGNWKMNHSPEGARVFFKELAPLIHSKPAIASAIKAGTLKAAVYVPAVSLETCLSEAKKYSLSIQIGSQNTHFEKSGAFTGEVSAPMLKEIGITSSLVAHSERRQYFGETDETARKRTESLLDQGMTVILCVGETRQERESNQTEAVLTRQLNGAIPTAGSGAAKYLDGRLIIAYEPVWAIGTGLTATPEQAEQAHQFIRKLIWDRFGMEASGRTPILYGGSVTPENVKSLLACANIDGALVGGASVKPASLLALLEAGASA